MERGKNTNLSYNRRKQVIKILNGDNWKCKRVIEIFRNKEMICQIKVSVRLSEVLNTGLVNKLNAYAHR